MRKISGLIFILFLLLNLSVVEVQAACLSNITPSSLIVAKDGQQITIKVSGDCLVNNLGYVLKIIGPGNQTRFFGNRILASANSVSFNFNLVGNLLDLGIWNFKVALPDGNSFNDALVVATGQYELVAALQGNPTIVAKKPSYMVGTLAEFTVTNAVVGTNYDFWWDGNTGVQVTKTAPGSTFDVSYPTPVDGAPRTRNFCMQPSQFSFWGLGLTCNVPGMYAPVQITITPVPAGGGAGGGAGMGTCPTDPNNPTVLDGVPTALGCVPTKPENFVAKLLGWVIGLGGGLAFLLIVFGGFQIVTSSGDPEKLNAGKEMIVSALTGLLMIVFSVILLHLIGVDILHIPGFGV